jgi:hypothetical protein
MFPGGGAGAGGSGLTLPGTTAGFGGTGAGLSTTPGMSSAFSGAGGTSGGFLSGLSSIARGAGQALGGANGMLSLASLASGAYGLKLAGDAREASDPFAPYRGIFANELMALEGNPNLITSRPGWSAGISAIDRGMAARGYTGSGNQAAALQRFGGEFYNNEANRLASLAGATQTPGAGQFPAAMLASQSLASIGNGLARYFSGG